MPSLLRAYELSTRAAQVGFDWPTTDDVLDKVEEEIRELRDAVSTTGATSREAEEEFGDLLFSLVNVARKLGIEPEAALRVANDKFQRRFDDLERQVKADGHKFRDLNLDHWNRCSKHVRLRSVGRRSRCLIAAEQPLRLPVAVERCRQRCERADLQQLAVGHNFDLAI